MSLRPQVKLYYDIISPYAWFCFETLCRYQKPWDIELQLRPVFAPKIMMASGNKPPHAIRSKGEYTVADFLRVAEMTDVPYNPLIDDYEAYRKRIVQIAATKRNVPSLRLLTACQVSQSQHLEELSRQIWLGILSRGEDIGEEANIRKYAQIAGIPDVDGLYELSKAPEALQQLKANTDEALESKCYGVPWITTINPKSGRREKFFGQDRVEMLGWVLGKKYVGHHPENCQ